MFISRWGRGYRNSIKVELFFAIILVSLFKIKLDKRYLIIPRSKGLSGNDSVSISIDNRIYKSAYEALFARSDPDFWSFHHLKLYKGKEVSIRISGPNAVGVELVRMSDTIPGKLPLHHQSGRPKVLFSPIRGWLNDPSGMIFFEGKWHLYYANTRFSNIVEFMNNGWGHATSSDLLHWEEQPLFLTPIRKECFYWTGGAAVDVENTRVWASQVSLLWYFRPTMAGKNRI